eukprot:UC1_evm1s1693
MDWGEEPELAPEMSFRSVGSSAATSPDATKSPSSDTNNTTNEPDIGRRGSFVEDMPSISPVAAATGGSGNSSSGGSSTGRRGSLTVPATDVFADMLEDEADTFASMNLAATTAATAAATAAAAAAAKLKSTGSNSGGASDGRSGSASGPRRRSSAGSAIMRLLSSASGGSDKDGGSNNNSSSSAGDNSGSTTTRVNAGTPREFPAAYLGHTIATSPRGLDVVRECAAKVSASDLAATRCTIRVTSDAVDLVQPEFRRIFRRVVMADVTFFCVHPDDKKVFVLIAHDRQHVTTCHCFRVKKEAQKIVAAVSEMRDVAKASGKLTDERNTPAAQWARNQLKKQAEDNTQPGRMGRRMSITRAQMVAAEAMIAAVDVQLLGEAAVSSAKDADLVAEIDTACGNVASAHAAASAVTCVLSLQPDGLKLTDPVSSELVLAVSMAQIRMAALRDSKKLLQRFKKGGGRGRQPLEQTPPDAGNARRGR